MARPTSNLLNTATPTTGTRVTVDDVVVASAGWLIYAIIPATIGWFTAPAFLAAASPLVFIGVLVGLTFLDIKIYKAPTPPVALMALSLGTYAYIVGALSWAYSTIGGGGIGLVGVAAAGTVGTAAAVIALYKARILRADTAKYRSMVIAASIGYGVVILASLTIQTLGGESLFGSGPLGWVLCLLGASLAALSLTLAAADIDQAINIGAPSAEASRLGWAFISTLLWLYLEILRLVSRSRS